jgi:hypothetical protein
LATPVPVNVKPVEHLVNWYAPVVLLHWRKLPVLLSTKQVSKVPLGADSTVGGRAEVVIMVIIATAANAAAALGRVVLIRSSETH